MFLFDNTNSEEIRSVEYIPYAAKAKQYFNEAEKLGVLNGSNEKKMKSKKTIAAVIYKYILTEFKDVLEEREINIYKQHIRDCFFPEIIESLRH